MTITVPEPVLDRASTLPDQAIKFGEHARRILRMQALDPEFLVVAHLPRRVRHDGIQILTDESTGIIARYLCRVDAGRAPAPPACDQKCRPRSLRSQRGVPGHHE